MRRERLYLTDIVEAADSISGFIGQRSKASFLDDDLLRSAVLQKLTVIGEAAARLPASICEAHPEVPWPDIVAFRNIAVHAYFAVDWAIVWTAASEEVPQLCRQIAGILGREFPADSEEK